MESGSKNKMKKSIINKNDDDESFVCLPANFPNRIKNKHIEKIK